MSEVERLELENKKMEERLVVLKENLSKQKEREADSIWKGGNSTRGSLNTYATDVLAKKQQAKNLTQKRYKGIADETQNELKSFELAVEKRLNQLEKLHNQSTGREGLPADPSLIIAPHPKVAAAAQPQTTLETTSAREEKVIYARQQPVDSPSNIVPEIKPTPPTLPPPTSSLQMWKIPSRPATPIAESNATPTSFLENLQTWTTAATASAAEIPSSSSLPNGPTTPFRIRRNRVKIINQPLSSTSKDTLTDSTENGIQSGGSLLQGDFDETSSHQSFLNGLEEWRRAGQKKKEETVEEKSPEAKGGRFLEGDFDETKSRESFLRALEHWRKGGESSTDKKNSESRVEDDTIGTSTTDSFGISGSKAMESTLKLLDSSESGISYLDKLLLARLRSETPTLELEGINQKESPDKDGGEDSEDSEDLVASVFWPPQLNIPKEFPEQNAFQTSPTVQFEFQVLSTTGNDYQSNGQSQYIVEEPDFEEDLELEIEQE
ncbi:hypothetical protein BCR33DRAFT_724439 [Rhizoclosmatium globosum]|uniref:Uncharacterized protein n=1 Tax=Rhizoclosmatium globosum TaxID=329046 RepID=A0A1Y2B6G5_9FUNG|nr:hypothetical protein BCR33DRAFT_724439 [Rhizoclosmatium globosum]|eukprot:ORY30130.1 hypothetical protein BCR33DRAFT_724439 [Rhizoclosmatium globosum]